MIGVQLKWQSFGQCDSFRGLINVPRMCLSWVSFGEVHTVWALYREHADHK